MKIQVSRVMKAKSSYTSQRETVVTSSFGACSLAMDDGGRCLLDVINDPKLLQSFLESGSDENSKDPQDGTSSESAVESPQVSRPSRHTNHLSSNEAIIENTDQMGYSYAVDGQGLLAQGTVCSSGASLVGMPLVVASSPINPQTYQHASSSGATIHHLPSAITHTNLHPHSPASARSATPNVKSPGQGPPSIHSMPPPSPLQQTRSPLPSHTPSPAPAWSPAPPVLSPAASRSQPSVAFQQSHNPIIQTTCSVTQFVTALAATQQPLTPKLTLQQQQQQQLFLQQQQQSAGRLTAVQSAVATSTIAVPQPQQQQMVQLIHAPSNMALPTRTSHSSVRPIQPKLPPQILPKPATSASSQFVSPAPTPKQAPPTPVTTNQRTVGVGIQQAAPSQLVIGQGQPGMFSGPGGTFLVNQIIPGMGQNPILIQSNLPGILTVRNPPGGAAPGQSLNSNTTQNNATLIAALQGPSQHTQALFAQTKSAIHGQQTIMIPNNIGNAGMASQNINLTPAGLQNSGLISSSQGQGLFARSNIILSPRVVGGSPGLQLQQIPTPTGSIITFPNGQAIAVPHLQTGLGGAHLAGPMHNIMTGQGVISGLSLQSHTPPTALHQQQQQSLFGTVPFSSHLEHSPHVIQVPQPLTTAPVNHPSHLQQQQHSPASPPKPAKIPGVNLEELLKEHGIVPESPLPSPDCNSPVMEEPVPSQQQQSLVPSQQQLLTALQSQQVVLEQPQGHPGVPLKLAITQDGSVIIQPHHLSNTPRVPQFLSSNQIIGRTANCVGSVILPTATTPAVTVPVVTTDTTTSHNHSTLIARLNAAPAISVPDVPSLALSSSVCISTTATSITTTTITTTATTLVPLTVQSLSMNSCSSSYVVQRTNPATLERVFIAEDGRTSQGHHVVTAPVISSSSSMQTVQSKINANSAIQALLIPSDHVSRTITHHVSKTVQSAGSQNVQTVKCAPPERDTQLVEIADNGAVVQNHNHATFPANVPNNTNTLLLRVQKEIDEMMIQKSHNIEQAKTLQALMSARQKLLMATQNKLKGPRAIQFQSKMEVDVEKILQKCRATQCVVSEPQQQQQQQQQTKVPVLTVQQSGHIEKQQNIKTANAHAHNLHLVNLLKQNSQHNAPAKHLVPPTTTITTVCDSTTTSTPAPVTTIQKVTQVLNTAPPRLQTAHQQVSNKSSAETVPPQVILRMQKPIQQQQPVQTAPNVVQIKGVTPVKKVVNLVPRPVQFSERLSRDQKAAVTPDVDTPFISKKDACSRLLAYHVFNAEIPAETEINKADEAFSGISIHLQNDFDRLFNRFRYSQLKESMRIAPVSENIMLERFFIDDEQEALKADKAAVAEGKSLSLPPLPTHWLEEQRAAAALKRETPSPPAVVQEEPRAAALRRATPSPPPPVVVREEKDFYPDEQDSYSREFSDHHAADDSDPPYKEDDNLEAPVIDSCEDIVVPPLDENCERSPPTLKRIVIKPSKRCESGDSEESAPSRKRFKFNSSSSASWADERPVVPKHSDKDSEARANHGYHEYLSETRISDIVSELQKELVMSPMEMNDNSMHGVDMEGVQPNHLADFEPPVPRTEEPSCSNALYDGGFRNNCSDFDLLTCSDWSSEYVSRRTNESDAAVANIVTNHANPSELDLSGLDGLGDHLDDSESCIPNGIGVEEEDMNCIGFRIPKDNKRFEGESSHALDQVQSAIKSITGTAPENHSYFDTTSYQSHQGSGYEEEARNQRGDPDLDEAVRSILI